MTGPLIASLANPMPAARVAAAGAAIVAGGALYCFGYTALQGDAENPLVAIAWATANLLPWLAAFELAKRTPGAARRLAVVVAAAAVSLLLEQGFGLIDLGASNAGFQLLRRLPGAGLVLLLLLLLPRLRLRDRQPAARTAAEPRDLPLLPVQIDWIRAAGNYLEFHHAGGMVMRRMTLAEAEAALAAHGFLRIHRSLLVNRSRIAGIRRGKLADEVELTGGQALKVGDAYRAALGALERPRAA